MEGIEFDYIHMHSSSADLIKLQGSSRRKLCVVAVKSSFALIGTTMCRNCRWLVAVKSSFALGTTSIMTAVKSCFALRKMFHVGAFKLISYKQMHMAIVGKTATSAAEQRERHHARVCGTPWGNR